MIGPGIAWQADMSRDRVPYDDAYMQKVAAYEDTQIARAVNHGRVAMISRHLKRHAWVLDYGAGTGAFVRAANAVGFYAYGYDVMPQAARSLRNAGVYAEPARHFDALTAWDSIEHMEAPEMMLKAVRPGAMLFLSLPVFEDLTAVRASKHYRPGEHLYYFTADGLERWLRGYGFLLMETSSHETDAGRESIGAFAFRREA